MKQTQSGLDKLLDGLRNRWKIRRKIRTKGPSPLLSINNFLFRREFGEGVAVMEKDWDNLILLDACRYDYFSQQNYIEGTLQPSVSKANYSWEFMEKNFVGREMHDTVYITANPYAEQLPDDVFYTVESVLDQWDEDLDAVRPQDVVDAAVDAYSRYPNKRLIIHFMQPHQPFLGETADRIRKQIDILGINQWRVHGHDTRTGISWWEAIRRGYVSRSDTRQAYQESLDIVLDHVSSLLSTVNGKSVITADHGEMLGERIMPFTDRRYGHPLDIYTSELCIVPWLEVKSDTRREIVSEDPIEFERLDETVVDKRLSALGYTLE